MSLDDQSNKQHPEQKPELPEWFADMKRKHDSAMKKPFLDLTEEDVEIWPSKEITKNLRKTAQKKKVEFDKVTAQRKQDSADLKKKQEYREKEPKVPTAKSSFHFGDVEHCQDL